MQQQSLATEVREESGINRIIDPIKLSRRVDEMLRYFPFDMDNEYRSQNCHGIAQYVLGLKRKPRASSADEFLFLMDIVLETETIAAENARIGDVVLFFGRERGGLFHSGIVMQNYSTNPFVFSAHGWAGCDIRTTSENIAFGKYYETVEYKAITGKGLFDKIYCYNQTP